jgi:hypothetical protein
MSDRPKQEPIIGIINILIAIFSVSIPELINAWLDNLYDYIKATRLNRAINRANTLFITSGKQYHVIGLKLKKMWITRYMVLTREDVKQGKKSKFFSPNVHMDDILKMAIYTTPSRLNYEVFKCGIPKSKKTNHGKV